MGALHPFFVFFKIHITSCDIFIFLKGLLSFPVAKVCLWGNLYSFPSSLKIFKLLGITFSNTFSALPPQTPLPPLHLYLSSPLPAPMHTRSVQGLQIYEYWAATVPSDTKSQLIGKDPDAWKDWGLEEKGASENEMVGWHHQLNGHEFGQTQGDSERQGSLAYCSSQGGKETKQQWCTFFFLACLLSSLPPSLPVLKPSFPAYFLLAYILLSCLLTFFPPSLPSFPF